MSVAIRDQEFSSSGRFPSLQPETETYWLHSPARATLSLSVAPGGTFIFADAISKVRGNQKLTQGI